MVYACFRKLSKKDAARSLAKMANDSLRIVGSSLKTVRCSSSVLTEGSVISQTVSEVRVAQKRADQWTDVDLLAHNLTNIHK